MDGAAIAVAVAAVLLGCVLQRTSGMGTGLVVSPALVLTIGPVTGVLLTNITTVVSAFLMSVLMRADLDRWRALRIVPVVVLGALPAALVVRAVPHGWLEVIIGAVLLLALGSTGLARRLPDFPVTPAAIVAGATGGFLNTTVGVSAPAMLVYARVTEWGHRSFAATLQPIFLTMGLMSIITKVSVGAVGPAEVPGWPVIAVVLSAVPVGVLVGGVVARRVSSRLARRIAVVVVSIGAAGTLVRGVVQLIAV